MSTDAIVDLKTLKPLGWSVTPKVLTIPFKEVWDR